METLEKLEACQRKKDEGNIFFKAGEYWRASKKYEKVIMCGGEMNLLYKVVKGLYYPDIDTDMGIDMRTRIPFISKTLRHEYRYNYPIHYKLLMLIL